jgi:hypothetical protein
MWSFYSGAGAFVRGVFKLGWGFDLRSLALFRIFLGAVAFCNLVERVSNDGLRAFLSSRGVLPPAYPYPHLDVLSAFPSVVGVGIFVGVLFVLSVCVLLGFCSRLSSFLLFLGQVLLHYRAAATESSGEMVLRLFLLWAVFFPVGARWSLDALLAARKSASGGRSVSLGVPQSGLAFVCFMVGLSMQYALNCFQKNWVTWSDPQVLYWALGDPEVATSAGIFFRGVLPAEVFSWAATGALLWEACLGLFLLLGICFPFFRAISGLMVWALHGSFVVFMDLGSFPWTYSAVGAVLLPSFFWDYLASLFRWDFLRSASSVVLSWGFARGGFWALSLFFFLLTLMSSYNSLFPRSFEGVSREVHSRWIYPLIGDLGLTCGWNLFYSPAPERAMCVLLGFRDGGWYDVARGERLVGAVSTPAEEGALVRDYCESLSGISGRVPSCWGVYFSRLGGPSSWEVREWLGRYLFEERGFSAWKVVWLVWRIPEGSVWPEVVSSSVYFSAERPVWLPVSVGDVAGATSAVRQVMSPYEGFWGPAAGRRPSVSRGLLRGTAWPPLGSQVLVAPREEGAFVLRLRGPSQGVTAPVSSEVLQPLSLRLTAGPDFGRFLVYAGDQRAEPLAVFDGYNSWGVVPKALSVLVPGSALSPGGVLELHFVPQRGNPRSSGNFLGVSGYFWGTDLGFTDSGSF